MPSELKYSIAALLLTVGSFFLPGGRVMTLPFFFAFVLFVGLMTWIALL